MMMMGGPIVKVEGLKVDGWTCSGVWWWLWWRNSRVKENCVQWWRWMILWCRWLMDVIESPMEWDNMIPWISAAMVFLCFDKAESVKDVAEINSMINLAVACDEEEEHGSFSYEEGEVRRLMEETNEEEVITSGYESDIICMLVTGFERDLSCIDSYSTLAHEKNKIQE